MLCWSPDPSAKRPHTGSAPAFQMGWCPLPHGLSSTVNEHLRWAQPPSTPGSLQSVCVCVFVSFMLFLYTVILCFCPRLSLTTALPCLFSVLAQIKQRHLLSIYCVPDALLGSQRKTVSCLPPTQIPALTWNSFLGFPPGLLLLSVIVTVSAPLMTPAFSSVV